MFCLLFISNLIFRQTRRHEANILRLGAFLGPCWAQDRSRAPKTVNLEPKEPSIFSTLSQNDPKMHAKTANLEPKWPTRHQTWKKKLPQQPSVRSKVVHNIPRRVAVRRGHLYIYIYIYIYNYIYIYIYKYLIIYI